MIMSIIYGKTSIIGENGNEYFLEIIQTHIKHFLYTSRIKRCYL